MAKKDDDRQPLPKFEDWLAPWEVGDDGKALEEPAEVDPARLKKHLYNLLSDKEKLQEARQTAEVERDEAKQQLADVQREHENDEQRREREQKEREKHYEKLEREAQQRRKVEAIEEAFEDQGITPAQARKLAKRVSGDDENAWVDDAKELVEDGFKIGTKKAEEKPKEDDDDNGDDDFNSMPKVVRSDGRQPTGATKPKYKSVDEELDAAGIGNKGW